MLLRTRHRPLASPVVFFESETNSVPQGSFTLLRQRRGEPEKAGIRTALFLYCTRPPFDDRLHARLTVDAAGDEEVRVVYGGSPPARHRGCLQFPRASQSTSKRLDLHARAKTKREETKNSTQKPGGDEQREMGGELNKTVKLKYPRSTPASTPTPVAPKPAPPASPVPVRTTKVSHTDNKHNNTRRTATRLLELGVREQAGAQLRSLCGRLKHRHQVRLLGDLRRKRTKINKAKGEEEEE